MGRHRLKPTELIRLLSATRTEDSFRAVDVAVLEDAWRELALHPARLQASCAQALLVVAVVVCRIAPPLFSCGEQDEAVNIRISSTC